MHFKFINPDLVLGLYIFLINLYLKSSLSCCHFDVSFFLFWVMSIPVSQLRLTGISHRFYDNNSNNSTNALSSNGAVNISPLLIIV